MASQGMRSQEYAGELNEVWPDTDIVVLPGFPDDSSPIEESLSESIYPSSATDVVKLLRVEGLTVAYAVERSERRLMSKNSAEFWLPVIIAVSELGASCRGHRGW